MSERKKTEKTEKTKKTEQKTENGRRTTALERGGPRSKRTFSLAFSDSTPVYWSTTISFTGPALERTMRSSDMRTNFQKLCFRHSLPWIFAFRPASAISMAFFRADGLTCGEWPSSRRGSLSLEVASVSSRRSLIVAFPPRR